MADLGRLAGRRFALIGRAGMDLYADPPDTRIESATRFTACLGGSSANSAAAIARLGGKPVLITCLSDDAVGRFCLAELDRYGIDRSHVRLVGGEARTSLAVVETRPLDTQSVIYRNGAADFALSDADVETIAYETLSGLVFTGTALAAEPSCSAVFRAVALARAASVPVVMDIDYRPYSWAGRDAASDACGRAARLSDVVVGNDVEFGLLGGGPDAGLTAARKLVAEGIRIVVFKQGELGSIALTASEEIVTGIYATEALKPTGAGDAFLGGFLMGLADGHDLGSAVARGSAAAAIVVSRVGCAPAMPTLAELEQFLAARPPPRTA